VDQTLKIQVFWDVVPYQPVQLDHPTLKMKAPLPFDMSVTVYLLTQCNIPKDFNLNLLIIYTLFTFTRMDSRGSNAQVL